MSWEKEVGEIERRKSLAKQMGGKEGIDRQKKRGKLTVRERIDHLVDKGSFREFMTLSGSARYEGRTRQPGPSLPSRRSRSGGTKAAVPASPATTAARRPA